jgi:Transcriptional repressor TCF25
VLHVDIWCTSSAYTSLSGCYCIFYRLPRTSLSLCRYVLALDPLRDPYDVLLVFDHFALASHTTRSDRLIVNMAENENMKILSRADDGAVLQCDLLSLPNWALSYALALFRLSQDTNAAEDRQRADNALRSAVINFPGTVMGLLQKNEVDMTGKSTCVDMRAVNEKLLDWCNRVSVFWLGSAGTATFSPSSVLMVRESLSNEYVKWNHAFWAKDDVLQWLLDNLQQLSNDPNMGDIELKPCNAALLRYCAFDLSVFDKHIQQFPPDANILDNDTLAQALVVETHRPRLLRRMHRADDDDGFEQQLRAMQNYTPTLAGPPTNVIDPGLPLLEVFWRSFFPWNRVAGVPPRR